MSASPTRRSASSRPYRQPAARLARTTGSVRGSGTATPEGSITQTITSLPDASDPDGLVLRLRGAHEPSVAAVDSRAPSTRRRIQWAEDVVDNEGLGRKKSKVCCIYHKTREFGESSDEDDSSDSSSEGSDGSDDDGSARPVGGKRRGRGRKTKDHKHDHEHGHGHGDDCGHEHTKRKPSPNAYEKMPKYDVKPLEKQPGS